MARVAALSWFMTEFKIAAFTQIRLQSSQRLNLNKAEKGQQQPDYGDYR
jgi:hypothetical protein